MVGEPAQKAKDGNEFITRGSKYINRLEFWLLFRAVKLYEPKNFYSNISIWKSEEVCNACSYTQDVRNYVYVQKNEGVIYFISTKRKLP